jgi:hypothetical protein
VGIHSEARIRIIRRDTTDGSDILTQVDAKRPKPLRKTLLAAGKEELAARLVKVGSRVEIVRLVDEYSHLGTGDRGTVEFIDDAGTIHVRLDSGENLGIVLEEDSIYLLEGEE